MNATECYLYGLRNRGSKYGLERMQRLVATLDQPQRSYPAIHVAGTNGKGSVCAMLESIYRHAGYRVGLLTSPHLVHLGERIQVNREPLCDEQITAYTQELRPVAESLAAGEVDMHPTFFELIAAMGFLHFQREQVDLAIIETGLGGRLDATNVVDPLASVITSIGLDHTEILGDTLAAIAVEKAGIIKPGKPVILGFLPAEAEAVIRSRAAELKAPVTAVPEVYPDPVAYPETSLAGSYQRINAATASLTANLLKSELKLTGEQCKAGLQRVDWAGRWQKLDLKAGKTLILDSTHNPEGARFLEEELKCLCKESNKKPVIVTGILGEERAAALMPVLGRHARELYLVEPQQARALPPERLMAFLEASEESKPTVHRIPLAELFHADGWCQAGQPGDTVVVVGSIYLIGEVLQRLQVEDNGSDSLQDHP